MQDTKPSNLRIVSLRAENIKKLVAIEITPKGDLVRITGRNGQGKTSILDSIFWALGGTDGIQDQPIRKGEKKAKIEIDLGDIIVKRTFTEKGTALTIENKQGMQFKSPQGMLDNLIGRLSFDPLEFMRQDAKKQFETLKVLTGVDLSALELKRAELFAERTNVNRNFKALDARFQALTVSEDGPHTEQDAGTLAAELAAAMEQNQKNEQAKQKLVDLRAAAARLGDEGTLLTQQSEELQAKIKALTGKAIEMNARVDEGAKYCAGLVDTDVAPLRAQLAGLDAQNRAARAYQDKEKLRQEMWRVNQDATTLSGAIDQIDGEKTAKISEAKFPLPDLGFGEGVVVYKGFPLEQASSAEQLRVSMAMAMSLNPKLRVIRITDGSLLDSASMQVIEEMAKTGDFQVWIEQVDESGKVGIVIEDGAVVAVNEPATT